MKTHKIAVLLVLLFALSRVFGQEFSSLAVKPQVLFQIDSRSDNGGILYADFVIPEGLHQILQKDFFYVTPQTSVPGLVWGDIVYPEALDEISGIPSYSGTVRLGLPFTGPAKSVEGIVVEAGWQLCYDDGSCLRPGSGIFTVGKIPHGGFSWISLLFYALTGILGGFLLNLMPCVLPVISLKVTGILKSGELQSKAVSKKFLLNAAGIFASVLIFAILTIFLKMTGQAAGWGFQFQNVYFIIGLIVLTWLMGLSFAGVWEAGGLLSHQTTRWGWAGDFLSGALVVVLATPCTAPFLGSAIGFAFASPLWAVVVIFLSAALGLALPFLVLAAFPQWVKFLPKPGLWMEKLKISLGFAMIAVTLWLVWVYSFGRSDSVFPMLSYLLILGLLAWIFGQRLTARKKSGRLLMSFIPLVLSVGFALLLVPEFKSFISGESRIGEESASAEDLPEPWIKFEESKIDQALKEGRFVFVDFTARWCLTCRVNEAGVLSSSEFLDNAKKENVLLLRGDYTNADPVIDEWLKKYRRAGVPFYLLLRPGRTPVLFGELLGPAFIKDFAGALMP